MVAPAGLRRPGDKGFDLPRGPASQIPGFRAAELRAIPAQRAQLHEERGSVTTGNVAAEVTLTRRGISKHWRC